MERKLRSRSMDVYQAAKVFGISIIESPEFAEYQRAQLDVENSSEDREIYHKYKEYKNYLIKDKSNYQQVVLLEEEARRRKLIKVLLDKEEHFNRMISNVKAVIEHYSGDIFRDEREKDCESGCSKGGCCKG